MVIVQVETREAVEDIDALLAVPGVDAALMGPADLSVALGTMDIAHPKVTEYIQRVLDAATRRGLPAGTHVGDLAMLKHWRDRGMRLLMYSYDFGLIMEGATRAIKDLRA
jgi:2-keto-3-deoxy-L-rhamnonate aldolase RhmA